MEDFVDTISTLVTVCDGVIQIPSELKSDPRFGEGATLKLVPVEPAADVKPTAKGDWRALEGIFADSEFDTTEWKRQEREFELAHEERKFGTRRPEW